MGFLYYCLALFAWLQAAPQAVESPNSQTAAKPAAVDAVGDPLPEGALLRLGTLRFHPSYGVRELALSPDGKAIVTLGNYLQVWDSADGKILWRANPGEHGLQSNGPSYACRPLAFAADSSRFYTPGNNDGEYLVWETLTGRHESVAIKIENPILRDRQENLRSIDVSSDGQKLVL